MPRSLQVWMSSSEKGGNTAQITSTYTHKTPPSGQDPPQVLWPQGLVQILKPFLSRETGEMAFFFYWNMMTHSLNAFFFSVAVVGNILFWLISWLGNVDDEKDLKFSKHSIGNLQNEMSLFLENKQTKKKPSLVLDINLVGKRLEWREAFGLGVTLV